MGWLLPGGPGFDGWAEALADWQAQAAVEGDRSGPGLADMVRGDDVGPVNADEAVGGEHFHKFLKAAEKYYRLGGIVEMELHVFAHTFYIYN